MIAIKGMNMPDNCRECRLYEGDYYGSYCYAQEKMLPQCTFRKQCKDEFCPLMDIKDGESK